jgi:hypothetical protein
MNNTSLYGVTGKLSREQFGKFVIIGRKSMLSDWLKPSYPDVNVHSYFLDVNPQNPQSL